MKGWHIIGITGDASCHCLPCARRTYGHETIQQVLDDTGRPYDHEGNELGPVFAVDMGDDDDQCTHCGDSLRASCWSS